MKIQIALLIFVMFLGSIGISYGQDEGATKVQKGPEVLLQLYLRNSDGQLVGYVEGTRILSIRPLWLDQYLDTQPDKKIISREGKPYELIHFAKVEKFNRFHSIAMYSLQVLEGEQYESVLLINHDAYQIEPGDVLSVYWTIIRPLG